MIRKVIRLVCPYCNNEMESGRIVISAQEVYRVQLSSGTLNKNAKREYSAYPKKTRSI